VRLDTLQRITQLPLSDTEQALAEPLLATLASSLPDEREAAASAIFTTYIGRDAPLVGKAVERILADRRTVVTVTQVFQAAIWQSRKLCWLLYLSATNNRFNCAHHPFISFG
jgi:hypothetical protein